MPKKEAESRIAIAGSVANDHIKVYDGNLLDHLSMLHPQFSVSLLVESLRMHRGGTGANIAYTLALLGEHPILLGSVGKEDREYVERLKSLGVVTTYIHYSKLHTARFEVVTDRENNQFATFYQGAMSDSDALSLTILPGSCDIAIISPHDPNMMHQQVLETKQRGMTLAFDIGQQVHNCDEQLLRDGVREADLLFLNAHEKEVLARRLGLREKEIDTQIPLCITTYGKDGSIITGSGIREEIHIPAVAIDEVVDPTGAGDAYRAGFLYGYAREWPIATCGRMGAVAAAYAVEHSGGQGHAFSRAEYTSRFEDAFQESIAL